MRKQCKRKVRPLIYNPMEYVMDGVKPTSDRVLNKLRMLELASLESMSKGMGTVADWSHLIDMVNLAEQFAKIGVGIEVMEHCQAAQAAMIDAARHYEQTKTMMLSDVGLHALREVYAYHDLQRQSVTRAEYEQVINRMANYIRSKGRDVVEV
tara:strand:+ start:612 stop:1070 length:459 start_codon:yes stop_codon:yes gene_type:complete